MSQFLELWGRWFQIVERLNVPPEKWKDPIYRAAIEECRELERRMRELDHKWSGSVDELFDDALP